jgi:hypothetical protein
MVRPRHRGNRLLHLPGISADPRARACGYSGSNPASALRRSHPSSSPRHRVAQPSSICFLCSSFHCASPTYESLYCASFIYLSPSYVTRLFALAHPSSISYSYVIVLRVPHLSVLLCSSFCCASLSISYSCVIILRVLCLFVLRAVLSCGKPRVPRGGKGIRLTGELGG